MLTGLHHRDKWWERSVLPALPLACQTSALLLSYAPELERVNGVAPSSRPWHGRIPLLNHTRVVSPAGFSPATRRLGCARSDALSYGDKMVGVPGNAPGLGTHLVRCEV